MGCGGGRACLPLEKHPLRAEQCKIQPVKRCPLFPFLISPFVITTWKARGLCGLAVFPVIWVHKGNTCEIRGCDAFHLPQTTDFSECLLTGMPQHAFKVLWFRSEDKIKLSYCCCSRCWKSVQVQDQVSEHGFTVNVPQLGPPLLFFCSWEFVPNEIRALSVWSWNGNCLKRGDWTQQALFHMKSEAHMMIGKRPFLGGVKVRYMSFICLPPVFSRPVLTGCLLVSGNFWHWLCCRLWEGVTASWTRGVSKEQRCKWLHRESWGNGQSGSYGMDRAALMC